MLRRALNKSERAWRRKCHAVRENIYSYSEPWWTDRQDKILPWKLDLAKFDIREETS